MMKNRFLQSVYICLLFLLLTSCQRVASLKDKQIIVENECLALFDSCEKLSQPSLPKRWHASALMAPFLAARKDLSRIDPTRHLIIADIIFDDNVGAQLNISYSANDNTLLEATLATRVAGNPRAVVYILTQTSSGLTQCERAPGNNPRFKSWLAPSTSWFIGESKTLGVAKIRDIADRGKQTKNDTLLKTLPYIDVEWWQTEIEFNGKTGTNWLWLDEENRWPYRTMMINSAADKKIPLIGDYSISYFLQFKKLSRTDLSYWRRFCESDDMDSPKSLTTVTHSNNTAKRDFTLHAGTKKTHELPSFPESFTATALMTPINYRYQPFPTKIRYDSVNSRLFTELYSAPDINDPPELPAIAALLFKDNGRITTCDGEAGMQPVTLGAPGPSWMQDGGCVIDIVMQRTGFEDTLAIRCPVKESPTETRLFWMWYSASGEPLTFMESNAHLDVGTSLSLADYRLWKRQEEHIGDHADRDYCKKDIPVLKPTNMPDGCYGCHGGKPVVTERKL